MNALDPYAAIRRINVSKSQAYNPSAAGEGGDGGSYYDLWSPDQATLDAMIAAGFDSKYNRFNGGSDGTLSATFQNPGRHKRDTLGGAYQLDPATGQYVMVGDPWATREVSSSEDMIRDPLETAAAFAAASAAMYGGGQALMGGGGTLGTIGAGSGEVGALGTVGQVAPITIPEVATVGGAVGGGGMGSLGTMGTVGGMGSSALLPTGSAAGMPAMGAVAAPAGSVAGGGMGGWGAIGSAISDVFTGNASANTYGNLLQAGIGLYGQNKAADAMKDAAQQASDFNRYAYDTSRADLAPYRQAGTQALGQIQSLLSNPSGITQDPGYQFGLNEGAKQLANRQAASGNYYSGAAMKAAQQYGQDYAGTKLNESYNRLANLAGLGQVGATGSANAAQNFGQAQSNNALGLGNVRGSGYMAGANLLGSAVGNIFNDGQARDVYGNIIRRGP